MSLNLFPHQIEGIDKITSVFTSGAHGFCLNDEMGLGKTITTICSIKELKFSKILCTCPNAVMDHWCKEILKIYDKDAVNIIYYHGDRRKMSLLSDKVNFIVTTGATLTSDIDRLVDKIDTYYNHDDMLKNSLWDIEWDLLLVDESHNVRNPTTTVFQSLTTINRKHTLLLTGTPFNNTMMDLATQLYLIKYPLPRINWSAIYYNRTTAKGLLLNPCCNIIKSSTVEETKQNVRSRSYTILELNKSLKGSYNTIDKLNGSKFTVVQALQKYQKLLSLCFDTELYIPFKEKQKLDAKKEELSKLLETSIGSLFQQKYDPSVITVSQTQTNFTMIFIRLIFGLDTCDKGYELLTCKGTLIEKIEELLYRKLAIMQWRVLLNELTPESKHYTFIDSIIASSMLRRSKESVKEIVIALKPMKIDTHQVILDETCKTLHDKYLAQFQQLWCSFNKIKYVYGNATEKLGVIMKILTKWRQSALSSMLVIAKEPVLSKTAQTKDSASAERKMFSYRDWLQERFNNGSCGTNLNTTFLENKIYTEIAETHAFPIDGKISAICKKVKEITDKGDSVVIFSGWVTYLMILREFITNQGNLCPIIDGGQTMNARNTLVNDFKQGKFKVLLASIKACGVGLTLTCANHVIFAEPSWNPFGEELQAMQRIHRIGQLKETYSTYFIAHIQDIPSGIRNSIDHYVQMLQDNKLKNAKILLGTEYLTTYQKNRIGDDDVCKSKLDRLASMAKNN